ncbi:hypothetical protein ZIOFF_064749 [Zingiber officinale]|uniref:DDE Tnp4 domain-containing protein n=1 Tax=Zingiber officinale TaxID=94328 RepID=A0A8J5EZI4_ZINOF|nr:hypothetical protein ZIOFF_064749 [Zingiber officinale]
MASSANCEVPLLGPDGHVNLLLGQLEISFELEGDDLGRRSGGKGIPSDEVWEDYFKSHPKHEHYRTDTFEDYEDLRLVVGNGTATGKYAIGLGDDTDARTFETEENGGTNLLDDYVFDHNSGEFIQSNRQESSYQPLFSEDLASPLPSQPMSSEDCIGAIDGTHIPAMVPGQDINSYRNRHGEISQNVLAACNFDLEFIYVLSGWEGFAHDSLVLTDALSRNNGLKVPGGVRSHLQEFTGQGRHPENAKELFNLHHASLRNAIERIFGDDPDEVKARLKYRAQAVVSNEVCLLKILMQVEQEQEVTKEAHLLAKQEASAQRHSAYVLQVILMVDSLF